MDANGLFLLEDIYARMQEVGLVTSKSEFSQRCLGKGASYLTSMRSRQRNVPDEVFAFFIGQLESGIANSAQWIAAHEEKLRLEMTRQHHQTELLREMRKRQNKAELPVLEKEGEMQPRSLFADIRRAFAMRKGMASLA